MSHYRQRVQQCETLGEYAMAEHICGILVQEQGHQVALASALGVEILNATKPQSRIDEQYRLNRPAGQGETSTSFSLESLTMLNLAITLLVIALILGLLGFGGIAGSFMGAAKILFMVFLVLAILSFVSGGMRRGQI